MKDYDVFKKWLDDVLDLIQGPSHNWPFKALEKEMKHGMMKKPKRARGKKGKFLADDPTTKDYNEAYVGGKAPKKKKRKK